MSDDDEKPLTLTRRDATDPDCEAYETVSAQQIAEGMTRGMIALRSSHDQLEINVFLYLDDKNTREGREFTYPLPLAGVPVDCDAACEIVNQLPKATAAPKWIYNFQQSKKGLRQTPKFKHGRTGTIKDTKKAYGPYHEWTEGQIQTWARERYGPALDYMRSEEMLTLIGRMGRAGRRGEGNEGSEQMNLIRQFWDQVFNHRWLWDGDQIRPKPAPEYHTPLERQLLRPFRLPRLSASTQTDPVAMKNDRKEALKGSEHEETKQELGRARAALAASTALRLQEKSELTANLEETKATLGTTRGRLEAIRDELAAEKSQHQVQMNELYLRLERKQRTISELEQKVKERGTEDAVLATKTNRELVRASAKIEVLEQANKETLERLVNLPRELERERNRGIFSFFYKHTPTDQD